MEAVDIWQRFGRDSSEIPQRSGRCLAEIFAEVWQRFGRDFAEISLEVWQRFGRGTAKAQ